jgi:hypothetical protein
MYTEQMQTQPLSQDQREQERAQRRWGVLTEMSLRDENRLYAGTRGVSENNRSLGFRPGYLNSLSGECVLSRFSDGNLAPVHILDGLPDAWVLTRDPSGRVMTVAPEVVSGFIRDGHFYTREEASRVATH